MALREHIQPSRGADRRHAVERLLDRLPRERQEELKDCLEDTEITSAQLSKAIKAEFGVSLTAERIRDWRLNNGVTGKS